VTAVLSNKLCQSIGLSPPIKAFMSWFLSLFFQYFSYYIKLSNGFTNLSVLICAADNIQFGQPCQRWPGVWPMCLQCSLVDCPVLSPVVSYHCCRIHLTSLAAVTIQHLTNYAAAWQSARKLTLNQKLQNIGHALGLHWMQEVFITCISPGNSKHGKPEKHGWMNPRHG